MDDDGPPPLTEVADDDSDHEEWSHRHHGRRFDDDDDNDSGTIFGLRFLIIFACFKSCFKTQEFQLKLFVLFLPNLFLEADKFPFSDDNSWSPPVNLPPPEQHVIGKYYPIFGRQYVDVTNFLYFISNLKMLKHFFTFVFQTSRKFQFPNRNLCLNQYLNPSSLY